MSRYVTNLDIKLNRIFERTLFFKCHFIGVDKKLKDGEYYVYPREQNEEPHDILYGTVYDENGNHVQGCLACRQCGEALLIYATNTKYRTHFKSKLSCNHFAGKPSYFFQYLFMRLLSNCELCV